MEYIGKGKNLMYYVDAADFEYSFTLYLQKLFFFCNLPCNLGKQICLQQNLWQNYRYTEKLKEKETRG